MTKRLLAVCWEMPPLSGPRAVQVSRTLAQLASLGWESTAVCFGPRSQRYLQDAELASRLRAPAGVTLFPVRSLEDVDDLGKGSRLERRPGRVSFAIFDHAIARRH